MISQGSIDFKLQELLIDSVQKIKADYAEVRAEETFSTKISFKGQDPDVIAQPHSLGFFIRVLINGSWGVVTFDDVLQLKEKIAQAVLSAKLQGKGRVILSPISPIQAVIQPVFENNFRQVPLQKKVNLVKHYNALLLKGAVGIQSTSTNYVDVVLTKFFANSLGSAILQTRPYTRLNYQATARKGDVIESYRGDEFGQKGFEIMIGLDKKMIEIAKQAVQISKAPKVKAGNYTVILDPLLAGTFAHEAFGHFSEADFQYQNPAVLDQMHIGRKLGSEKVTIVDNPSLEGGWGNFVYDDEGVIAKRVNLLTSGIITSRLHSRETAAVLKEEPNGRARADGFSSVPLIRMSNTYFERGQDKLSGMISSTKKGILAVNWYAGMTAMENFTFTALYGVMIENGKLTNRVRGVKLMGNLFETLQSIDAVSDDFMHDSGTCGKEGQHISVGSGGAFIRANNVAVGGE